ncbi:MAG: cohesin domain-containing protein [Lentisphaeria bacterium]|jgi:hypothetical protein|nr:cohesin domain-containing protein [Lentisphaeria bacterium]
MRYLKPILRIGLLAGMLAGWTLAAATVMVHDLDVRDKTVGSTIDVAVRVSGLTPASFSAFGLDFAYDRVGLNWTGVSRGALLAAEGGSASTQYAPYWWALEASHEAAAGTLRVSGMILGRNAGDNTTAGMAAARVPASEGILLVLHFTLLAKGDYSVELVSGSADGRCVLSDDAASGGELDEADLVAGGTLTQGMPNWWALEHFGDPEHDPAADDDLDWRTNAEEYVEATDPVEPDQAFTFFPGWNMLGFRVIPAQTPAEWIAAVNAASRSRDTGDLLSATVFHYVPDRMRYVVPDTFEPGVAYWFYAFAAGDVQFDGTSVPTDYEVEMSNGWQMVAVPERLTLAALDAHIEESLRWDAETQNNVVPPDDGIEPAIGYWLYRWEAK